MLKSQFFNDIGPIGTAPKATGGQVDRVDGNDQFWWLYRVKFLSLMVNLPFFDGSFLRLNRPIFVFDA